MLRSHADSKALTADQREKLFALVKATSWMGWLVDVISPQDMSVGRAERSRNSALTPG
jgi:ribonuclease HII